MFWHDRFIPATCLLLLAGISLLQATGCDGVAGSEAGDGETSRPVLRIASTTSTRDSGLLDLLLPEFERQKKCRVKLIAVGTGAALKLGEAGEADAVLVHAPAAEEAFMEAGHGIRHESIMHNFFLIVGPNDDPAGIRDRNAVTALQKIAAAEFPFVSRGDRSGTHLRELSLWEQAGIDPDWPAFEQTGQGMGGALTVADQHDAYLLIDEGTWLRQRDRTRLVPLVTGVDELRNPYSVIVVNPDKHPKINHPLAEALADFLISKRGQDLIDSFTVDGRKLFRPDRLTDVPVLPAAESDG